MRKLATVAALVVFAFGVAACSTGSGGPATPTTAADETRAVCTEAIAEGTAAASEFKAKLNEGVQAVLAGDQAKATQLETEMHERLGQWAAKLTDLSNKSIKPEVKAVLTEAAATLTALNSEQDQTPVDQVETKFTELGAKLATACA